MLVVMGSGGETVQETVAALERARRAGRRRCRCGCTGRSRRRRSSRRCPRPCAAIAVLDRTKEPGSIGEPLFLDTVAALTESYADGERAVMPRVVGGRYGLSSKEFTPGMVAGVFDELARRAAAAPVHDRHQRRRLRDEPDLRRGARHRAARDGARDLLRPRLGRDGRREQEHDQDPRRRGGPARAGLLRLRLEEVRLADGLAPALRAAADPGALPRAAGELRRLPPVRAARPGRRARPRGGRRDAAAQLPAPAGRGVGRAVPPGPGADPRQAHRPVRDRRRPDRPRGRPRRTDQHHPPDLLLRRSPACCRASRRSSGSRRRSRRPTAGAAPRWSSATRPRSTARSKACTGSRCPSGRRPTRGLPPVVPAHAPEFVRTVTAEMLAGRGDDLPVSALPVDGTYPSGTAAYEKRNISELVAVWDSDLCIQCGNCSFVCPHSVIRSRYYDESRLEGAPDGFRSAPLDAVGLPDTRYTLQVYVEDCTGCELCVEACPVVAPGDPVRKAINLAPREPLVAAERENIAFFETLPASDRSRVDFGTVRGTQFLEPLFEFSGACAGCGETPYLKLLSQLFGDRLMVANATGCSSIYGGNLPTTPWTTDADGRGPAWSNSLFEDNAEFGLGFRLAADRHTELARRRLAELRDAVGAELVDEILDAPQLRESELRAQRERVAELRRRLDAARRRRRRRPAERRRPPRPAQRLDRRRRRLGLRHRLRRARPRPRQRAQRQRARARHRGLLEHRRPDVQGDAARRGREVRRRRQDRAEEGPRPAGDRLRQRLRRPGRDGRRPAADAERLPRGGGLRRPVARARVQPLHRARHRDARRARPAVPRRRERLLAADPLRPGGPRGRRQPVPARLAAAAHPARRLHQPRAALPHADEHRPGRGRAAARAGRAGGRRSAGTCTRRWRPAARSTSPPTRARSADGPLDRATWASRCATRSSRRRRRSRRPWTACGGSPTPASARSSSTRSSRSSCAARRPRTRGSSTPAPRASPSRSPTSRPPPRTRPARAAT